MQKGKAKSHLFLSLNEQQFEMANYGVRKPALGEALLHFIYGSGLFHSEQRKHPEQRGDLAFQAIYKGKMSPTST